MQSIIDVKGISRHFKVGDQIVKALKHIDLEVHKNEFTALMGASGSGKSTLMNILGCLDTPTSGTYMLNGLDVSKMQDSELAEVRNKFIGFVFQTFNLMPKYSALDNVALPLIYAGIPKKDRTERATEVLKLVGLENRMHHKPNELSGGQRQRVAIARALVNKPALILADEPTGNLDSATSYEIMQLFNELHAQGNTILIVTHEEDIAAYTKRTVRLKDGLVLSSTANADAQ